MALRALDAEVRKIIDADASISMVPFIRAANVLVDWLDEKDNADANQLTAAELIDIEVWLAAHFYEKRDQQYSNRSTGGASAGFQGQTAFVLTSTFWGQTACVIDTTNRLAQRSKEAETGIKAKAKMRWLGRPQSAQTGYVK